jgi:hypothetical protein
VVGTGLNSNVVAMAAIGSNLYVAGQFTNAGGIAASHIAKWDGNTWSALGAGVVGKGTVYALTTLSNNLYAAGSFTNMGGVSANRIAKWDGINWSALGSGAVIAGSSSGSVLALAASNNDLFEGGNCRVTGGKPSWYVGRWNDQLNFNIPQLLNPVWLPGRQFQVRLMGIPGLTNMIQATTDFSTWTPLLTNSTGIYDFTDTSAPNYPRRFYRAALRQ